MSKTVKIKIGDLEIECVDDEIANIEFESAGWAEAIKADKEAENAFLSDFTDVINKHFPGIKNGCYTFEFEIGKPCREVDKT